MCRSVAVQSTNQSNRQQLAIRNWLHVHSEGSCGDSAQPKLPRAHWEGSALGHFIVFSSQAFLYESQGCFWQGNMNLGYSVWTHHLCLSRGWNDEGPCIVPLFWIGKGLEQGWIPGLNASGSPSASMVATTHPSWSSPMQTQSFLNPTFQKFYCH